MSEAVADPRAPDAPLDDALLHAGQLGLAKVVTEMIRRVVLM